MSARADERGCWAASAAYEDRTAARHYRLAAAADADAASFLLARQSFIVSSLTSDFAPLMAAACAADAARLRADAVHHRELARTARRRASAYLRAAAGLDLACCAAHL